MNLGTGASSMWLLQKSEIWDNFCFQGQGVWYTNLPLTPLTTDFCKEKLANVEREDAVSYYCSDSSPLPEMCSYVTAGRSMLVLGSLSCFLALVFLIQANRSSTEDLLAKRNALRGAFAFSFACFAFHGVLIGVMAGSPLFYPDYLTYLGRNNPVNYKQLGCVFQSPFVGGIQGLMAPRHPQECVYPGPALVFVCWILVFSLMVLTMLAVLLMKIRQLDPARLHTVQRYAWGAAQVDSTRLLMGPTDSDGGAVSYNYSLHGALTRHLENYLPPIQRRFVGVLIPLLCMGSGCLFVAWFYHGQQFLVHVLVHDVVEEGGKGKPFGVTFTDMTLQVFTFDPVTTLKTFWDSGGHLLTVVTAMWIDFFPFIKIIGWTLMWFMPMSEVTRGRFLTWFDALGKYSLITVFVLNITTVAFLFKSRLLIPIPLPGSHRGIAVDIEVQYQPGRGVDWFIIALLWTMVLGSSFVELHSRCKKWEETRRTNAAAREPQSRDSGDELMQDTPVMSIGGLVGEAARRARERLLDAVREEGPSMSLSRAPVYETHVFSATGRVVVYSALLFTLLVTLVGLTMPVVSFRRYGFTGELLVNSQDRNVSFSLGDFAVHIAQVGGPTKPMAFSFIMIFFGLLMPTFHIAGMFLLWGLPLRCSAQSLLFRVVEFLDNWAALDMFVLAVFIVWFGIENISFKIVKEVVPGLTKAVLFVDPGMEAVYPIESHLLNGFWVLLLSSVARAVMSFMLMELCAMSIAQRKARQGNYFTPGAGGGLGPASTHVLQPNELMLFSPAQRYIGVSEVSSNYLYAGLPKAVWKWGTRMGLMEPLPPGS